MLVGLCLALKGLGVLDVLPCLLDSMLLEPVVEVACPETFRRFDGDLDLLLLNLK